VVSFTGAKEHGMAEDQGGMRKDYLKELAPWTTLFSAFKVALDPKKLVLAGTGLLTMALGWYVLSVIFFALGGKKPEWAAYVTAGDDVATRQERWKEFKRDRHRWNLLYEMAGTPTATDKPNKPLEYAQYDIGDVANSPKEYDAIDKERQAIDEALRRLDEKIGYGDVPLFFLKIGTNINLPASVKDEDRDKLLADLKAGKLTIKDFKITGKGENAIIAVGPYDLKPINPNDKATMEALSQAQQYKDAARTIEDIRTEVREDRREARITNLALWLRTSRYKPYGRLRAMPWDEDRGANPYLLVSGNLGAAAEGTFRPLPWVRGQFLPWLLGDQVPVLLEPLVKFFRPIVYLLDPAGGFLNRAYLVLVILWSLVTWALFGGAITRIAAVQVARSNERVGFGESLKFVWARYKSYLCAPLFPLGFLLFIVIALVIFGLIEAWTFAVGDILFVLLWPLILLAGLVMAVVVVGLVGYPLMYTTISAEGSDSFDAISRSYSYVYQAPWQYVWYGLVALCYGAVLVFFVGFMGSLIVYSSKWAVSQAPVSDSREPSYLFMWAPTSYGWRDLLLYKSVNAETVPEINNRGQVVSVTDLRVTPTYELSPTNYFAAFVVSVCLYVLFLLVVGFSYSYFWTASTIIYLLMRRKVDDTELDEIHLEEEPEQTWTPPATTGTTEPPKSNAMPVQMVESPALRTPAAPAESPILKTPPEPAQIQPTPPSATPEPPHETPPPDSAH
jgi:hypothetical protein